MAIEKCGECGHDVSSKAKTCPECGHPLVKMKSFVFRMFRALLLAVLAVAVLVGWNAFKIIRSVNDPRPEMSQLKIEEHSGLYNGNIEFGYNVTFQLENKGHSGLIEVSPLLSCSEGEWSRTQKVTLDYAELRMMTFFFHEPTVNASNVEVRLTSAKANEQ